MVYFVTSEQVYDVYKLRGEASFFKLPTISL